MTWRPACALPSLAETAALTDDSWARTSTRTATPVHAAAAVDTATMTCATASAWTAGARTTWASMRTPAWASTHTATAATTSTATTPHTATARATLAVPGPLS